MNKMGVGLGDWRGKEKIERLVIWLSGRGLAKQVPGPKFHFQPKKEKKKPEQLFFKMRRKESILCEWPGLATSWHNHIVYPVSCGL